MSGKSKNKQCYGNSDALRESYQDPFTCSTAILITSSVLSEQTIERLMALICLVPIGKTRLKIHRKDYNIKHITILIA